MSDSVKKPPATSPIGKTVLIVVCIVLVAVLLAMFLISSATDMFGLRGDSDTIVEITITEGMGAGQIASELKKAGVITQTSTFRLYSTLIRKASGQFQAGTYVFNTRMGYDEIIIMLRSGNVSLDVVTITFFEGMTLREIARTLEQKKVCSASDFIAATETADFDFEFLKMLPDKEHTWRRLEGYLYPDTYDFYVNENAYSVLRKFLVNFSQRVFPDVYEEILDAGFTLDEAITLASVIQKEVGNIEDMHLVSSVFHNRLGSAEYPRLQSDVTIFYVEGNIKPYMDYTNQALYDAYNTYACEGLPVGPICSPGMDAIRAAIEPDDTDYFYFVADREGTSYYAETLAEHNRNIAKAQLVGLDHGTATSDD